MVDLQVKYRIFLRYYAAEEETHLTDLFGSMLSNFIDFTFSLVVNSRLDIVWLELFLI